MALAPPPGPVILTTDQTDYLQRPPKPYEPNVVLVNEDGTPTDVFHTFLIKQYEWQRRLYAVLTGVN